MLCSMLHEFFSRTDRPCFQWPLSRPSSSPSLSPPDVVKEALRVGAKAKGLD
jgi:hypothetical protein